MPPPLISSDQIRRLKHFESQFNPAAAHRFEEECRIIGYGEISVVMTLRGWDGVVLKRMAGFREDEAEPYRALVQAYIAALTARGLRVVQTESASVRTPRNGIVVYLVQPAFPEDQLGHQWLRRATPDHLPPLLDRLLETLVPLYRANQAAGEEATLAVDAQISNWVWNAATRELDYFDVGTPLMRRNGTELLSAEWALRTVPLPLRPLFRRAVMPEVVGRYYRLPDILTDFVANFIKEGRADLVAPAMAHINAWLTHPASDMGVAPLEEAHVRRYYARDARIWTWYLRVRRLDRMAHWALGKTYPYVLPAAIDRHV